MRHISRTRWDAPTKEHEADLRRERARTVTRELMIMLVGFAIGLLFF